MIFSDEILNAQLVHIFEFGQILAYNKADLTPDHLSLLKHAKQNDHFKMNQIVNTN